MLIVPPVPFRRKRKSTAPVILTKAIYNSSGLFIELTFDRAINSSGLNGSQIRVDDGPGGLWYRGTGTVIVLSANSLRIFLTLGGSTSGPSDLLNVSAGNGIVAVNDGGGWAGVSNLAMPFG